MSDLRVALVAEGPTDAIVIEAALKGLLPRPFVLTQLQPEPTRPKLGTGWGGVLRWCLEFAMRGHARMEDDPTLPGFDLFVIHVDADVAEGTYADVSDELVEVARRHGWPVLPSSVPCPPPTGSVDAARTCLLSWSGLQTLGPKTVLCVPSKAIDAWLASAVLDDGHRLLNGLECNLNLEAQLKALPQAERVRKTMREYRTREKQITDAWAIVRNRCSQAERFSNDVVAVTA
ncbi:MAG TPA: hypothetical protein VFK02_26080 [Kofleriaceae bacterium]|nr:hypothetical protein [Kofleriaceae bacterium]